MTVAADFAFSLTLIAVIFSGALCEIHIVENQSKAAIETEQPRDRNLSKVVSKTYPYKNYHCLYVPGYRMPKRKTELRCCKLVEKRFYRQWFSGRNYLTTFLDTLKQWDCPELERQCNSRFFDFTSFTNIAYMRVCRPEKYRNRCFDTVSKLATTDENRAHFRLSLSNVAESDWQNMVYGLNSKGMSDEELNDPCIQVALYEGGRGGPGRFHESIEVTLPFCGVVWCGYDADTVYGRTISLWTCMPMGCRAGIAISSAIVGCLGLATLASNLLIIAVYWYKWRMNSSQIVYKVTLAIGDVLVGAVVFPTFISTFFMLYTSRHLMGDFLKPIQNESLNGTSLELRRMPSGAYHRSFPDPYLNAVGFFTTLSIVISVYTLMLASFDRMAAVCRPMVYDRKTALYFAKYSCAVLGLLGCIAATLPIYTSELRYGLVSSILVSLTGKTALYFYAVALLLPLFLVWVSSITLFVYSKKHMTVRRQISSVSNMQVSETEKRLVKTLVIMVGVFTATVLPAVATILAPLFVNNVYYALPEKLNKTAANAMTTAEFISVVILTTNSLWNCFIYGSRDKDFGPTARLLLRVVSVKLGLSAVPKNSKSVNNRRPTTTSITSNSTIVFTTKSKLSLSSDNESNSVALKSVSTSFGDRAIREDTTTHDVTDENPIGRALLPDERIRNDSTIPTSNHTIPLKE